MKKKIFLFLLISIFILPFNVSAKEAFDILNYDVDVKVNIDNTLDITEDITVFFNNQRHGIIRKIPFKNNIIGKDEKVRKQRAKISEINVDNNFSVESFDGFKNIKIGSSSEFVSGEKNYKISYKYDLGPDKNKKFDEFYFNVIGTDWNTTIDKANITIHMPKEYDTSKFGVSVGSYGYQGSTEQTADYRFEGNDIYVSTKQRLNPYEGVNIRIELPDKYFDRVDKLSKTARNIVIAQVLFLLGSIFIWFMFGKDREVVETVEFYPPEGLNSAELGFVYDKTTRSSTVLSLLIYLANKGYLKIEEEDTKGKDFKLIKLKEYDGSNKVEQTFFDGLFKKGDVVKKSDLKYSFYSVVNHVKMLLHKDLLKYFEWKSYAFKFLIIIFTVLTALSIFMLPILSNSFSNTSLFLFFLPNILPMFVFYFIMMILSTGKFSKFFFIYMFIFMFAFGFTFIITNDFYLEKSFIIVIVTGIISMFIQLKLHDLMEKRTVKGAELIGKINGFKRFLETAEKNKLEALVLDDPTYFYNILPYTYALGISDKWVKKFNDIAIEPVEWYSSNSLSGFNATSFNRTLDSMMNTMNVTSNSGSSSSYSSGSFRSSHRSGGHSGGGGRSGGGSGGGGGSSW